MLGLFGCCCWAVLTVQTLYRTRRSRSAELAHCLWFFCFLSSMTDPVATVLGRSFTCLLKGEFWNKHGFLKRNDIIGDKHLVIELVILSLYMQCPLTQIKNGKHVCITSWGCFVEMRQLTLCLMFSETHWCTLNDMLLYTYNLGTLFQVYEFSFW